MTLPLVTAILAASAMSAPVADSAGAPEKPNVVLIISDDQAYTDFGFMGNPHVRTPNLDRLAALSARYPNAYVPSSVCRPSLATLLTGRYPHQHGIHFNHPPPGLPALNRMSHDDYYATRGRAEALIRSMPALPRILAEQGYDCLQTGKYWEGHYQTAGFTHGMTTGRAAGVPGCWDKTLPDGTTVAHGNGDMGLTIGRSTMQPLSEFIDRHDAPGAPPFLIWYAPVLPHEPHNPPEKHLDVYRGNPGIPPHLVEYYATCTWFDETVGQLVRCLEQKGLHGRTLFLFVVDNGWAPSTKPKKAGGYGVNARSKRSPFEAGLRTPILIRWDGRVKPATHEELVSSIDVVPTLLAAAGCAALAPDLPGTSLLPSATGRSRLDAGRPVFGEIYPGDATALRRPARDVAYRWVRQGKLKLIVPHAPENKRAWGGYLTEEALFDVVADTDESTNLIRQPAYTEQAAKLRGLLDAWWTPGNDSAVPKPVSHLSR